MQIALNLIIIQKNNYQSWNGFWNRGQQQDYAEVLNKMRSCERVLDLGCSSGVLGLFCELQFDGEVDYVDVDQDAINNCMENRKLNNITKVANTVLRSDFSPSLGYDLLVGEDIKTSP